ncbi:MAG: helix-turn-helix transcriptional regulator [Bacillota bacterium]
MKNLQKMMSKKDFNSYISYLRSNPEARFSASEELQNYIEELEKDEIIESQYQNAMTEIEENELENELREVTERIRKNFIYELQNMDMTQSELASKIGVSQAVISKYKNGRLPTMAIFTRICEELNLNANDILLND